LLVVPPEYLDAESPLYITQPESVAMWCKALGVDGDRIVDIRVTENPGEMAKYVTKPGGYLELTDGCAEVGNLGASKKGTQFAGRLRRGPTIEAPFVLGVLGLGLIGQGAARAQRHSSVAGANIVTPTAQ
jgi:hypothetical protein